MNFKHCIPFLISVLFSFKSLGQGEPIGSWRAHMTYNNAVSAATDGVTIYAGSSQSFFTYNKAQQETTPYSKAEGMADIGISCIGYDAMTDYAIIAYTNGNIDLFRDGTFFNIPDIKLKSIAPKRINHIFTENGLAYISTSFGIVVLNLEKKETRETYSFISNSQNIEVREFNSDSGYFYAVTDHGLYSAPKNSPNLQAFSSWQQISSAQNLNSIEFAHNTLYISNPDSLFRLENDSLLFVYQTPYAINSLDKNGTDLFVNEYISQSFSGYVKVLNTAAHLISDSFRVLGRAVNTLVLSDQSVWVADEFNGLGYRNEHHELSFMNPNGPSGESAFDILPYNGDVWVAHGGYNEGWTYLYNGSGLSHYKDHKWIQYNKVNYAPFRDHDLTDFITLAKDPVDGTLYAGSYRSGLFILKPDGSYDWQKANGALTEGHFIDTGSYRVAGLCFDQGGNLWLNNAGARHEIAVRTRDGGSYKYSGAGAFVYSAYVLTDDYNIKWYILPNGADGIVAYNDNHTPDNPSDDVSVKIVTSRYGVNSFINCIAKDKQNAVWIGTNDGIGVLNCSPDQIASGSCEIRKPKVQYDQFAGYLFQNEKVKTIAVDGANRKWVGTTNGVWLVSEDGNKIIYRFTAENSPLPSNTVQKIAVDPVTGDVYIGTTAGLVSFRSTATDGNPAEENLVSFPNPVPSGYSGTIAISGLTENADVRITDISGQLIFRTKALGGQAVWNGLDYTGRRPQSGVYLIFATNRDGTRTQTGKMVFME